MGCSGQSQQSPIGATRKTCVIRIQKWNSAASPRLGCSCAIEYHVAAELMAKQPGTLLDRAGGGRRRWSAVAVVKVVEVR